MVRPRRLKQQRRLLRMTTRSPQCRAKARRPVQLHRPVTGQASCLRLLLARGPLDNRHRDRVSDGMLSRHLRPRRPRLAAQLPRSRSFGPVRSAARRQALGRAQGPPAGFPAPRFRQGGAQGRHVPATTRSRPLRAWASLGRRDPALQIKAGQVGRGRRRAVLRLPEAAPGSKACPDRILQ
jgi:hypothetical protein